MGLLPTGSDKLLEIQSGNIYVVIKSKNPHPNLTNKSILQQPSELRVTGVDVNSKTTSSNCTKGLARRAAYDKIDLFFA